MKKLLLLTALLIAVSIAHAQSPKPPSKPVYIKIVTLKLTDLYDLISTYTKAPVTDAQKSVMKYDINHLLKEIEVRVDSIRVDTIKHK